MNKVISTKYNTNESPYSAMLDVFQSILLALILTSICVRVVFIQIYDNSLIISGLFIAFIIAGLLKKNGKLIIFSKGQSFVVLICMYIFIYDFIFVILDFSLINEWLKFILCILTSVMASKMSVKQIYHSLISILIIVFFFSIYSYFNFNTIIANMSFITGLNYLVITLPIGCATAMTLVMVYTSKNIKTKLAYVGVTAVFFIAMLQYPGRGNIIFPLLAVIIVCMFEAFSSLKQALKIIVLFIIGFYLITYLYQSFASDYLQLRFKELFYDTASETRVSIYRDYLTYILRDFHWLLGIGFKQSISIFQYYPHNFMLELFGENGIIGLVVDIMIVVIIVNQYLYIKRNIDVLKKYPKNEHNRYKQVFLLVTAVLLYYFFTFFKSFSVYDVYQLFIAIGLIVALKRELTALKGES